MSKKYLYTHTEVDYGLRREFAPSTPRNRTRKWLSYSVFAIASALVLDITFNSEIDTPTVAQDATLIDIPQTASDPAIAQNDVAIILAGQQLLAEEENITNEENEQTDSAHVGELALTMIPHPTPTLSPVPHQPLVTVAQTTPVATERTISVDIKRGDTVGKIFEKQGFDSVLLHDMIESETVQRALSKIHPGQALDFTISPANELVRLEYNMNELERLVVDVEHGKPDAEIIERDIEELLTFANATIDDSLFMAAEREGIDQNVTMELVRIFGWDIDFALDIHKGDRFSVIYEDRYVDGEKITPGDIIAAEFINQGKAYRAIRYETADGQADYYTPEGHSMRKAFIRTPVEFARVSSKFNPHRRHPILHTIRAHNGVDYAAAKGTPVRATGNGVISVAGTQNGYGKVIEIQHGSQYSTLYAHLNGFASNIKKGTSVKQGQVIGYVGMTGMATGPHLHYEFRVNGVHKDPLTMELPNSDPIHAKHRSQFLAHASGVLKQLSNYQSIELAEVKPSAPLLPNTKQGA